MPLVDEPGPVHAPQVEGVAVPVIVAGRQVHRLEGVKAEGHRLVGQSYLLDRGLPSEVVQQEGAVRAGGGEEVGVRGVVLGFEDAVNVPLQLVDGLGPLVGPHLHNLPRSHELLFLGRVLHIP